MSEYKPEKPKSLSLEEQNEHLRHSIKMLEIENDLLKASETLRDRIAIAAMQGMYANGLYGHLESWGERAELIIEESFMAADEYLKQRGKENE